MTSPGTGITAEDLASVRDAQQEMMPEWVTLYQRVEARDSRGGTTETWTARTPQTIGRVGHVRDTVRAAFAGQLRGKATAMLTCPVGVPLVENDRVGVIGGLYRVVADMSKSSYATSARYLIEEV